MTTRAPESAMEIEVPESEVIDRITILELKQAHLDGPAAAHAAERRSMLVDRWQRVHGMLEDLPELGRLRELNRQLWEVEDHLRALEASGDFGDAFVGHARSVYRLNDERAHVKRAIDARTGSRWREHKHYGVTRPG